jgi:hypothetical protein
MEICLLCILFLCSLMPMRRDGHCDSGVLSSVCLCLTVSVFNCVWFRNPQYTVTLALSCLQLNRNEIRVRLSLLKDAWISIGVFFYLLESSVLSVLWAPLYGKIHIKLSVLEETYLHGNMWQGESFLFVSS